MTHPTDDELEAMARRLEDGRVCSPAQNSCRNGYLMLEAAAMLRALSGTLKAEKRHKLAITGDKINAVSELRQVKAERDALKAQLAEAATHALDRLDASLFTNAEHQQAKDILRAFLARHQKEAEE